MRGMQGALIVASCFQMLIDFLRVWRNVVRFLTPLSMVPLMTFTGLNWAVLSWFSNGYIPYPFQWGRPAFQAGEAFAMMAASLESTGTFLATARYGSATPVPASVLKGYKQDNPQRSNLQEKKIYSPVHDYIFKKGELR